MRHSRTIPFFPGLLDQAPEHTDIFLLTDAAWAFARSLLWPTHDFSRSEQDATQEHIRTYFRLSTNPHKAFVVFCERIVITRRFIAAEPSSRYVPAPSIWFNRHYEHGFVGTLNWYNQIAAQRKLIPGYLRHFTVLAEQYLAYVQRPSARLLKTVRKKLLEHHAHGLLQYFYNAIVHHNYSI